MVVLLAFCWNREAIAESWLLRPGLDASTPKPRDAILDHDVESSPKPCSFSISSAQKEGIHGCWCGVFKGAVSVQPRQDRLHLDMCIVVWGNWCQWWSWGTCKKGVEAAEFSGVMVCGCMVLVCGSPVPAGVCEWECVVWGSWWSWAWGTVLTIRSQLFSGFVNGAYNSLRSRSASDGP